MERIGIVAGNGKLPHIASAYAQKKAYEVYICAISGEADASLESCATKITWVKLGELKKLASFFLNYDVLTVCFAGKITKLSIFSGHVKPDLDMVLLFAKLKDKKDDTILGAICDYLVQKGISVIDSTTFLQDCMPGKGVLTKKKPSKQYQDDITFGWTLAKESARLDIGQSVVVKDKAVLAIEAIEGTDEAIKRGGKLGYGNVVVVKVAKPQQDMRFDVPTIGPTTIESMVEANACVLAYEAEKTLFVDYDDVIRIANKYHLVIIGL